MINDLIQQLKTRLETVTGLAVETEQKQVLQNFLPVCFIDINSVKPVGDANFPRYQQKSKAIASFFLIVYHSSSHELLDLIEEIETALKVTEQLSGTMDFQYSGYDIAAKESGKKLVAAQLQISVQFIKTF
jgi:hypothetical protein